MLWGVSRQHISLHYNNPPESKKRVRLRQKKIIELGATCLMYNITHRELIKLIDMVKVFNQS